MRIVRVIPAFAALMLLFTTASAQTASLPDNARPGECYARVLTSPTFQNKSERLVKQEAGETIRVVPATFDTVTERVQVRAPGEKLIIVDEAGQPYRGAMKPEVRTLADGSIEIVPTAFEVVTERVLVKEAYERMEAVPAAYETVTERIMVAPARQEWKPAEGRIYGNAVRDNSGSQITRSNAETGQLMCLVEVPAEYRTVTKRVLKTPATSRKAAVPAEYKTITKRVPKKVATKVVPTPAEYETVTRQVVKTPAQVVKNTTPAEYETITRREKMSDGDVTWMPVLCEVNVTRDTIVALQRSLKVKGFDPGSIDGRLGQGTWDAIFAFQRANNLASGELTIQTLDKLGVTL